MKEFGSNFQSVNTFDSKRAHLTDVFRDAYLLANGRQCIIALIRQYGWKRIWMPEYFSAKVIKSIQEGTGVDVVFYQDSPIKEGAVNSLPFVRDDVLLRMNYFGMRELRRNKDISIPVIEDHSHDPFGHWALYSDADWCVSSIRKFLPLPEGGMLWSPKGFKLTVNICQTEANEQIAQARWKGMEKKAQYLGGEDVVKDVYRDIFSETEAQLAQSDISSIDERSKQFITEQLDINLWLGAKRKNWKLLCELIRCEHCKIVEPEDDSCNMFSLILLCESKEYRDDLRKKLIAQDVYPAILWELSDNVSLEAIDFSHRMISIHCDGRYTKEEVMSLAEIINRSLSF